MIIKEIEGWMCHHPLPGPFYPSWIPDYPQTKNSCLVLIVRTDAGVEGISAGVAFGDEAAGLPGLLRPFLLGRDPFKIEDHIQTLRSAYMLGYKAFFVELALWDIVGKVAGLPINKLLGGGADKIQVYASTGELRNAQKRADEALALYEQGFKAIKLRVRWNDMKKDIEYVRVVREAVGDKMDIMVDANQGWPISGLGAWPRWDLKRAVQTAREYEALGVRWLEEPLFKHDYEGLAALRNSTSIRIAGGEFNTDLHEFRDIINRGCLDIVQPDITLSGGIMTAKKVAAMAEAANLQFSPHTWTNGIGLAASLQVVAAVPNCPICEFPIEPPGWVPEARDFMLTEPFVPDKKGFLKVPQKPGLGVELNMDAIKACGVKV